MCGARCGRACGQCSKRPASPTSPPVRCPGTSAGSPTTTAARNPSAGTRSTSGPNLAEPHCQPVDWILYSLQPREDSDAAYRVSSRSVGEGDTCRLMGCTHRRSTAGELGFGGRECG